MIFQRKILPLLGVLLTLFSVTVLGFHYIEGQNWLDSIYATVITLGTVGYGDIVPKDDAGKIFTIFIVMIGLGVISYTALELTAFVVEGHLNRMLRLRKVDNMIKKVQGHFIVCGAGKTGRNIVKELIKNKVPFVIIDKNVDQLDDPDIHSHPHLTGDATDDEMLLRAGIAKAKGLAAALDSDELNLFMVLTAKNLNHDIRVVAKCVNEANRPKLMRAGADAVVAPLTIGGLRMASELVRPNIVSFLDVMLRSAKGVRFEEATIPPDSKAVGKTLEQLDIYKHVSISPVAIREGGKEFHYNPSPKYHLKAGDTLVVIAEPEKLHKLKSYLSA